MPPEEFHTHMCEECLRGYICTCTGHPICPTCGNGPSTHLTWMELACKDGTRYPHQWRRTRATRLADAFELVRARIMRPIIVDSAYRTPQYNRMIGGARHSQHLEGLALDIRLEHPCTWLANFTKMSDNYRLLYDAVNAIAENTKLIRGIGYYASFIHMDLRPTERLVVWYGKRKTN